MSQEQLQPTDVRVGIEMVLQKSQQGLRVSRAIEK